MIVGVYSKEVPPVPIPNTEVKLFRVEDTRLATTRKNRSVPAQIKKRLSFLTSVFLFVENDVIRRVVKNNIY